MAKDHSGGGAGRQQPSIPDKGGGKGQSVPYTAKQGSGPKRQTQRGSKTFRVPGDRVVKEYPVTREELLQLAGLGFLGSFFLSVGSTCLIEFHTISMSIDFADRVPVELVERWRGRKDIFLIATIVSYLASLFSFGLFGGHLRSIIKSTEHRDE